MKALTLWSGLFALLLVSSCRQSCDCYKSCIYYSNNTRELCHSPGADYYTDSLRFYTAADSMTALYGPSSGSSPDRPITVSGSTSAVSSATQQLEQQGYHCECRWSE